MRQRPAAWQRAVLISEMGHDLFVMHCMTSTVMHCITSSCLQVAEGKAAHSTAAQAAGEADAPPAKRVKLESDVAQVRTALACSPCGAVLRCAGKAIPQPVRDASIRRILCMGWLPVAPISAAIQRLTRLCSVQANGNGYLADDAMDAERDSPDADELAADAPTAARPAAAGQAAAADEASTPVGTAPVAAETKARAPDSFRDPDTLRQLEDLQPGCCVLSLR